MDSNNMYPNQQTGGPEPENGQSMNYGDNNYQNNNIYQQESNQNSYQEPYQNAYQNSYPEPNQNAYQNSYQEPYQNAYQEPNQDPNYQSYQYNNGNYQVPYPQAPQMDLEEPMRMGEWMITLLIMMIPCVNLVMMFVWAFSKTEKKSKSNYFKASLLMSAIIFGIYLVMVILIAAIGIAAGY